MARIFPSTHEGLQHEDFGQDKHETTATIWDAQRLTPPKKSQAAGAAAPCTSDSVSFVRFMVPKALEPRWRRVRGTLLSREDGRTRWLSGGGPPRQEQGRCPCLQRMPTLGSQCIPATLLHSKPLALRRGHCRQPCKNRLPVQASTATEKCLLTSSGFTDAHAARFEDPVKRPKADRCGLTLNPNATPPRRLRVLLPSLPGMVLQHPR